MNDAPNKSPADVFQRRVVRLNFWVVWGFAALDVSMALVPLSPVNDGVAALSCIAAVTCQVSLLTIWFALGQEKLVERLLIIAPAYGLAAWALGALSHGDPSSRPAAFALVLLFLFNAMIPYGLLRLLAVRCMRLDPHVELHNSDSSRRPMQFSLAALFKATFVVACAAGMIRLIQPRMDEWVGEIALLGLASLFALGGIWSMLTRGACVPRAALVVAISMLGGLAVDRMVAGLTHARPEPELVSLWVGINLTGMLAVLAFYRRLGFRVLR